MTAVDTVRRQSAEQEEEPGTVYARRVERGVEVAAVVLVLATLAGGWLWLPTSPSGWTTVHWILLGYTAVAVPGTLVALFGLAARRLAMRVVTGCAPVLALIVLLRAGEDWDTGGGTISVLGHVLVGGLHASSQSWGRRGSLVIAGLTLPAHAAERVLATGPSVGLAESLSLTMIYLICLLVPTIFRQLASLVLRTSEERRRAEHDTHLVRAAVQVRATWDALVHDRVLAALRLGYRGDAAGAQDMARESLQSLDRLRELDDPRLLDEHLTSIAERLGLNLTLTQSGRDPDRLTRETRMTLGAALEQALTNVAQHSGTDRVSVHVHGDERGVRVEVVDDGRGFVAADVPPDRLGLRTTIRDRVELVGGETLVDTAPGEGTSVTVRVPWTRQVGSGPDPSWLRQQLRPLLAVGLAHILAQVTLALASDEPGRSRQVIAVGALALIGATVVLVRARGRTVTWWTAYLTLLLVAVPFAANVTRVWPPSEQTWFHGAYVFPVVVVTVGAGWRWAVLLVLNLVAVEWAVCWLRGEPFGVDVFLVVLAAVAVVVQLLTRGVRAGERVVDEQVAVRWQLEGERQERILSVREAEERRLLLRDQVLPQLRRLAAGEARLDEDERRTCRLLELSARDQLVARPLLGAPLDGAVAAARERGATVDLYCDDDAVVPPAFLRVAAAVLHHAGEQDRARVSWRPRPGEGPGAVAGTVTLTDGRPVPGQDRQRLVQELAGWEGVEVLTVAGDVLVQVRAPGP